VIVSVGNDYGIVSIHHNPKGVSKMGEGTHAVSKALTMIAPRQTSRHRHHAPITRHHPPNATVARVGDNEQSVHVERQSRRLIETRRRRVAVGKTPLARPAPGDSDYGTFCGRHPADTVVAVIAHINDTLRIDREAPRVLEARSSAHGVDEPAHATACKGGDGAVGRDTAQTVVEGVGHHEAAVTVHREATGLVEARLGPQAWSKFSKVSALPYLPIKS
jgi:hypothetical protein